MAKKELKYNDLSVNMIIQVKSEFEHAFKKYKKNERFTIVKLDDEAHSVTIIKDGKEQSFCMYEINQCFRKPKHRNKDVTKVVAIHKDVQSVIINGDTIIVTLETEFKGVATCDEESIFNEHHGYMIAYYKAKKKEVNYRYRADKKSYIATIKAAQLMLRDIEKNHFKVNKMYEHYIRMAIREVEAIPPAPSPNF